MEENVILSRINKLIKDNNLTPNKLAVLCKLQSNAFTKWKSGFAQPSLNALIKIANYFNVSLDYLVGRDCLQDIKTDDSTNTRKLVSEAIDRGINENKTIQPRKTKSN